MEEREAKHIVLGYGTYFLIWCGLVILTAVTVFVSGMDLGRLSVYTALCVALVKTGLVLFFFMHLKYEQRLFQVMLLVAVITLTVFIGLTFLDISYR
jgi:cytochrome c oxidase subunit IV